MRDREVRRGTTICRMDSEAGITNAIRNPGDESIMRTHDNLTCKGGMKTRRSLTERQILRFAKLTAEDTMTQREAIYTRYEKFEEELAHCYFLLHERFISDPALARFWAEAAMDEMQHFSMLRF